MNVYDFDGTIYAGDAIVGFAFYCMDRQPALWFTFFPRALWWLILYKRGKMTRAAMMRKFFSFLGKVRDLDGKIEKFWDKNQHRIAAWYLKQKREDDLIITASPACVISPMTKRLNVRLAATEYDPESGVFLDNLMYAKGKARCMIDQGFPVIDNFYSDSLADTPIALCAEKAHFVTDRARKVGDWPHLDPETMKTVRRKIETGWTIHL